jgi:hypothetical protein
MGRRKTLKTFVPITSKNSVSGHPYSRLDHSTLERQISGKSTHTRPDHFYCILSSSHSHMEVQCRPLIHQTGKLFIFARGNSFSRPGIFIFMHSQAAEYVCFRNSWTVTLTKTNNTFGQIPCRFSCSSCL